MRKDLLVQKANGLDRPGDSRGLEGQRPTQRFISALLAATLTVCIAFVHVLIAPDVHAQTRMLLPTSAYANPANVPGYFDSYQAVCDARAVFINWPYPLRFVATDDHQGQCIWTRSSGEIEVMGYPSFGGYCPARYQMVNFVADRSSTKFPFFYGPDQYCESQLPVVDRYWLVLLQQCKRGGQPSGGNPIYPLTGAKSQEEILGSWLGERFAVRYDTSERLPTNLPGAGMAGNATAPSFGALWRSTAHKSLVLQVVNGIVLGVQASRGGGQWVSFTRDSAGRYAAVGGSDDALSLVGGAWTYVDASRQAIETYDAAGRLTEVAQASGRKLTYSYSTSGTPAATAPAAGLLIRIQDQTGRAVQLFYEKPAGGQAPRVYKITDPSGKNLDFGYDAAGNLRTITRPGAAPQTFLYEHPSLTWALTGIVAEDGVRRSTYGYDDEGRAVFTELAGGVDRFQLSYGTPPAWNVVETIDEAAGVIWRDHYWKLPVKPAMRPPGAGTDLTYEFETVAGTPRLKSQSQPAGSGCQASTSMQTFDVNGNVASRDDFNGTRVCLSNDLNRNLETRRVEGLDKTAACGDLTKDGAPLPKGSRKIATAWHPDWPLETKRTEPRRITRYVYNGQPDPLNAGVALYCAKAEPQLPNGPQNTPLLPDGKPIAVLCKKIEQASTDSTGSAGLAAVRDGSVPDRVWSYTYNAAGQVLTETDPLGKVTQYAYYDVTTADYTKGDLKSVTNPASQVTTFTKYNKHGQVLESGDPNKLLTVNTYDDRQRLKTASVGGLLTTHDYWPNGLLKQVTQPDASFVSYEYDAAQRLRVVKDHLGNRIDYTPDNAGNSKTQTVKDPNGVLRRQLNRDFDALGRVQRTTGRE